MAGLTRLDCTKVTQLANVPANVLCLSLPANVVFGDKGFLVNSPDEVELFKPAKISARLQTLYFAQPARTLS